MDESNSIRDIKPLIKNLNDPIMLRSVEKTLRETGEPNKSDHDEYNAQNGKSEDAEVLQNTR